MEKKTIFESSGGIYKIYPNILRLLPILRYDGAYIYVSKTFKVLNFEFFFVLRPNNI